MRAALVLSGIAGCAALALGCGDNADDAVAEYEYPAGLSVGVDVLWVIDSGSWAGPAQLLAVQQFDGFVRELLSHDIDVQAGVVSADIRDATQQGRLQRRIGCLNSPAEVTAPARCAEVTLPSSFLTRSQYRDASGTVDVSRFVADFECVALVGTCGDRYPSYMKNALRALTPGIVPANEGFLRANTELVVVFVGSGDDCSFSDGTNAFRDQDCYSDAAQANLMDAEAVFQALVALKGGDASRVHLAGFGGTSEGPPRQTAPRIGSEGLERACEGFFPASNGEREFSVFAYGRRVAALTRLAGTGAVYSDLCQPLAANPLRPMAERIRARVKAGVCLPEAPPTCLSDRDCEAGANCVNPGVPASGQRFCSDFEVFLSFNSPEAPARFVEIPGPGAAGLPTPLADAQFAIDYDAAACEHGVAFALRPGAVPPAGSRYRVNFPQPVQPTPTFGDTGTTGN